MVHLSVEGCDNLVLQLVRNGLKVQFWSKLLDLGISVKPTQKSLASFVRDLDHALGKSDAAAAAELVYGLMSTQRTVALEQLVQLRAHGVETQVPPAAADKNKRDSSSE